MKKLTVILKNTFVLCLVLSICFVFCLVLQNVFNESALTTAIFVLGVFLVSVITSEYVYGIASALISVLAVNFAFTFPYFAFDFTIPENIVSAAILLMVTMITCSLTTKVRHHEIIKAESEKERLRANLLRAVSHDLRTPLTTIYGASSALKDNYNEFSDVQRTQMLKGISEDAQWLIRMVENLLSITRLDGGNVKLIKTETVLDELIDSVLVKFAKRYPKQEIAVELPEEFVSIPMDALLIEQVIINILENAVQHAHGMTKISLKVYTMSGKAVFEIADDGCGIDEEKLKDVFRGIYKGDIKYPDSGKSNAGIGLSVCKSIIKAHGGNIEAKNQKNGGCIFSFELNMEENNV